MEGKPKLGFMSLINKVESEDKLISVYDLIPHEDNFYSISDIESLEDAIELRGGIKENLIVTPYQDKYKVISGHRRRQALLNLLERGIEVSDLVPCRVEEFETMAEETIALILANSASRKLTEWEKVEQYKRLKVPLAEYFKANKIPGRMRDFIAETIGVSSSKIAKTENIINNLSDECKEQFKSGSINYSTAAELASLPVEKQKEFANKDLTVATVKSVKVPLADYNTVAAMKSFKKLIEDMINELKGKTDNSSVAKVNYYTKHLKTVEKGLFEICGTKIF